jgi:hypothetical protein
MFENEKVEVVLTIDPKSLTNIILNDYSERYNSIQQKMIERHRSTVKLTVVGDEGCVLSLNEELKGKVFYALFEAIEHYFDN